MDSKSTPAKSSYRETRNSGFNSQNQTNDNDIMKYDFSAYEEQFLKNLVTFDKNRSKNIKIMPTKVI